jgi:hypothetical protein
MKTLSGKFGKEDDILEFELEELLKETDKAYLVRIEGEEMWLPKSQVDVEDDIVYISEWLAKEKNLT